MRNEHFGDVEVILQEISLCVAFFRPEHLVQVRERNALLANRELDVARSRNCGQAQWTYGSMRVVTFNANGIRSAARKGFFPWMLANNPDVVCIQETKAQEHQLPGDAVLAGYSGVYLDAARKGYSGVAIYARREPQRIVRGLRTGFLDDEARFLRFDFAEYSVCSLYVPSGTSGPERQAVKY